MKHLMIAFSTKLVGNLYVNKLYIYMCVRDDGLRHCTSNRKVACSILDGLIRILLTLSFRPHFGPAVASASNRKEYQVNLLEGKGGRCVGLTTLPF
jgi:hypothetical protein